MALTVGTGLFGRSPAGDFNLAYEAQHPFDVAGEARTDDVLGVAHQVATRCSASVSVPADRRRPPTRPNSAATHADHGPRTKAVEDAPRLLQHQHERGRRR